MKRILPLSLRLATAGLALSAASLRADLGAYQKAVQNETGLVSYYTFDAGNAVDVKSAHNGTAAGVVSYGPGVGGAAGKALVLKGTGQINLDQVEAFDFVSGKGTVEAWIRADWTSNPGYNPAIITDRDGGPVNWSLHLNSGKDAAGLWNGSTYSPLSISKADTNWHHLAAVFDVDSGTGGGTFTLYWDGNPLGTTQQGLGTAPESPTELGASSLNGAERWIGALDEVAFYSDALGAAAIKAHYLAFLAGAPPEIVAQPQGGAFLTGIPLTLSVSAKGTELSYAWFKDGAAVPNATNATLTIAQLSPDSIGAYRVVVANAAGQATSQVAQVQLGQLPAKLQRYQTAVRAETSLLSYYTFDKVDAADTKGTHSGVAQGLVRYGDGIGAGAGKALVMDGAGHVNLGQVDEFGFPTGQGTVEAWIRADWTNNLGYNPAIFTCRDVGLVTWSVHMNDAKDAAGMWNGSAYQALTTPGVGTGWHHLAAVFATDDFGMPGFTLYWDGAVAGTTAQGLGIDTSLPVELGSASVNGQERWVGALDEVAFYSAALSADQILAHFTAFVSGNPPTITQQPLGGSYFQGGPLTLSAGAQGLDLRYQWLKNGVAIDGATTAQLAFAALTAGDGAAYTIRVSNADGAVESAEAVVRVIVPNLAAYQKAVRQETNLLAYYTFDNGDATDSKSGYDGTPIENATFPTGIGGGADKAFASDGTGHIDLGTVEAFDFASGKGTVETWLRADWTANPGYDPTIFASRDGGPVNWSVHMSRGKDAAGLWNGSAYQALTIVGIGVTWHHLAVVFDRDDAGGLFTLYWDGVPAGVTHQAINAATGLPTELGSASAFGQERWLGMLDEVAFYTAPLSATAILSHYRAMVGAPLERPKLSFTRNGGQIVLSWPADATGFTLEAASSLPATAWTPVSGVANNSVSLDASKEAKFFRLRQ